MGNARQDDDLDLSADVGLCRGCGERRVLCAHGQCSQCHRGPTRRGCLGLSTDRPVHLCCGWWGYADAATVAMYYVWHGAHEERYMSDRLSPEAYAATGGSACPACAGTDLARGRFDSQHADTVTRRWGCENCGATWTAVYELMGYEGLQTPRKDD